MSRATRGKVYAIRGKDTGLYKIGYTSSDVRSRKQSLQTGCPFELEIVFWIYGDENTESEIHRTLAGYRKRENSEWFEVETFATLVSIFRQYGELRDSRGTLSISVDDDARKNLVGADPKPRYHWSARRILGFSVPDVCEAQVELSFEENVTNTRHDVGVLRLPLCPRCAGTGRDEDVPVIKCEKCVDSFKCPTCNGTQVRPVHADDYCAECDGRGFLKIEENVSVEVPPRGSSPHVSQRS